MPRQAIHVALGRSLLESVSELPSPGRLGAAAGAVVCRRPGGWRIVNGTDYWPIQDICIRVLSSQLIRVAETV